MDRVHREILNRMGIDVWQLRQARSEPAAPPLKKVAPLQPAMETIPSPTPAIAAPANRQDKNRSSVPGRPPAVASDWQFEVLYLLSGDFAMIVDREDYCGPQRRLADDLLRMFGSTKSKPQVVSFSWPQLNAGTREAALGAWQAFIKKRLENSPQLFVVESELCQQLAAAIPLKFHWIPKLSRLLASSQAKRDLWQALKSQTR